MEAISSIMPTSYSYVSCPLCGADDAVEVFPATSRDGSGLAVEAYRCTSPGYGTHDRIVRCKRCAMVYSNPRPVNEKILDSYKAVEDPTYLEEQEGRRLTFTHHIRHMESIIGKPGDRSLIDVGCYTGVFVEVALSHGWQATGVEPSHWAATYAKSRGLPVIEGTLQSARLPDASQDVVTLWDVIEHLPNPLEVLREVARVTRPGGWVVIHTMDIDSLMAKVMRDRWPWLMQMHLIYFSQRTMAEMLRSVGFEPVSSGPMGRYLRLGYFATRIGALSPQAGRVVGSIVDGLRIRQIPIPLNFGDLFTVYARKGRP